MDDGRPSRRTATRRTSRVAEPRPFPADSLPRATAERRSSAQRRVSERAGSPVPAAPRNLRTAANYVTFIRVAATFVWVLMATFLRPEEGGGFSWPLFLLAIFFALIAFTDSLDGYLARSRNEITDVGKFMDPIADKLICIAALLVLFGWDHLSIWVPVVIIGREFLVSGLRMVVASKGEVVAASIIGKWKTGFTMGAIIGYLVGLSLAAGAFQTVILSASWLAMLVAVVLTIWSGVDYLLQCRDYLS